MKELLNKNIIQKTVDELKKKYSGKKIIIYGAGDYFLYLRDNIDLSDLNIVGISDKKFEVSKAENPSKYLALTPDELKDFDFDVIFVLLKNDEKLSDYIEYQLLMNTKNENKLVIPMLKKGFKNKAGEHYKKGKGLYNFILNITSDEDLIKLNEQLKETKKRAKNGFLK